MPRNLARFVVLLTLPLLAACEDSPTGPASYAQVVDGATWVAVSEPAGMASADEWVAYAAPAAAAESRVLRASAARARSAGHIAEALELDARALLGAAASLERAPPSERVRAPLAALDAWVARARARLAVAPHPVLGEAAGLAAAQADSARFRLAAGDTAAAVLHLARGTVAAREHAPMAVGARLLSALEARLQDVAPGASSQRARRLLAGAREGLATGDTVRALRRVVYAHQLLDAASPTLDSLDAPR